MLKPEDIKIGAKVKMSFSFKKGTCQQKYHGYNHQAVEKYGFCVGHIKRIVGEGVRGEGVRTLMYIAWDSNEMWGDTNLTETKHFENELDLVE
jgi:hypothetical protein